MAVIDEVADVAAAEAVEAASATSVVGHFGPASREAKPADSPTPTTTSVPDRREVAEAVEEEVEAAMVVADDRPAVVGSGNRHKMPVAETTAVGVAAAAVVATVVRVDREAQVDIDGATVVPDGAADIQ